MTTPSQRKPVCLLGRRHGLERRHLRPDGWSTSGPDTGGHPVLTSAGEKAAQGQAGDRRRLRGSAEAPPRNALRYREYQGLGLVDDFADVALHEAINLIETRIEAGCGDVEVAFDLGRSVSDLSGDALKPYARRLGGEDGAFVAESRIPRLWADSPPQNWQAPGRVAPRPDWRGVRAGAGLTPAVNGGGGLTSRSPSLPSMALEQLTKGCHVPGTLRHCRSSRIGQPVNPTDRAGARRIESGDDKAAGLELPQPQVGGSWLPAPVHTGRRLQTLGELVAVTGTVGEQHQQMGAHEGTPSHSIARCHVPRRRIPRPPRQACTVAEGPRTPIDDETAVGSGQP